LKLCNQAGGKILTVHSVRTPKTVLNMIEKYFSLGHGRVILHWFTGSKAEAKRAVELGCYFSVNAEMLRNEHHSGMVRTLPVNRILTETDGPFCKYQSRPIKPTDVINAVNLLANLFSKEPSELAQMIASNLKDLEAF
jgi:TatD DNase family protein